MLGAQVHFVSAGLNTSVDAVGALVGLVARVPLLVPAQRVMVGRGVRALLAAEGLFAGVQAQVHLERRAVAGRVAARRAVERLLFLVNGADVTS